MASRGGDTGRDLRLVLEVAAVGKADRKAEPFGLAVEVLVVGVGVDAAKNRVSRFTLATIWTRLRANREHITGARAFLKARWMTRDDRKSRFVYAPRLAVPESDMRLFRKSSLVLLLEKRNILSHDFDTFLESFLDIYHFHFPLSTL